MADRNVMGEDEACSFAMALATGSVPPMVLKVVIELDVLEIIKRAGPDAHLSPKEIVAQLPTKNPGAAAMLDRMLRLLASHDVLSCHVRTLPSGQVERTYGLAPVCQFLTKNEDVPTTEGICLLTQDRVIIESWHHLKNAVLNGGVAMKAARGTTLHEYQETDPRFNELFNSSLANYSRVVMKKLLENYRGFGGLSTLVDVGGGTGMTLNMIISKYPTIKGINFDMPYVVKDAPAYKGIEHVGGNMYVSIPKADAIFIKWTICDWSDEQAHELLKNCYEALPHNGKVIVCEYNSPVKPDTSHSSRAILQVDVIHLANYDGGKERTEQEFEALAKKAGFKAMKVACSAYDFKVMEFLKNN